MAQDVPNFYNFIIGSVPSYQYDDPAGLELIKQQKPVILRGSNLVSTAMKWDLNYLSENIGVGPFAVFSHRLSSSSKKLSSKKSKLTSQSTEDTKQSNSDDEEENVVDDECSHKSNITKVHQQKPLASNKIHIFKYYDERKMKDFVGDFVPEIEREEISFQQFLERFNGDRTKERVYLQQALNNTVGRPIAEDFVGFNWHWTVEKQKEWMWGPLTSNLLLIGQEGNVTPCHYDEQQNLFCQLKGRKKFILFAPENFGCLYPHPVHHPFDRQSQVDIDAPDFVRFPNFRNVKGVEAIVEPGCILYIPMYWWHEVINLDDTIAINFWHKAGPNSPIQYPLKARQKVAMVRNVEKMLLEALQDQNELGSILHWIVDGRF